MLITNEAGGLPAARHRRQPLQRFEPLVIAFVRGLSVRDVETSPADTFGSASSVSKSTVSRVCGA